MNNDQAPSTTTPGRSLAVPILAAILIVVAAANGYLLWRVNSLATDLASVRNSVAQLNSMASVSATNETENMKALRQELDTTKSQAEAAKARADASVGEAKTEAQKVARQLSAQQKKQQQKLASELTEVKESASNAHTRIADVSNDVAATKTQLGATQSQLDKTVSDLKSVTGDMGVMSGKIATNGEELAALKALGQRNYVEFRVARDKDLHKVGDVQIRLKKADPKRNRFTIDVLADDRQVEKKDKTLNEPVQFYLAKARQPYEIVVNEVKKDEIVGYLAAPKVEVARK